MPSDDAASYTQELKLATTRAQQAKLLRLWGRSLSSASWKDIVGSGVLDVMTNIAMNTKVNLAQKSWHDEMQILSSVIEYITMHLTIIMGDEDPSTKRLLETRCGAIFTQSFRVLKHPGILSASRDYYRFIDQVAHVTDTFTLPDFFGQDANFLRTWDLAETMDFVHSLYFNLLGWNNDGTNPGYEKTMLHTAGNVTYTFGEHDIIDDGAAKRAVARYGSRPIAKRMVDLLSKDIYTKGNLEKFHIQLGHTLYPLIAKDFIKEGGHTALVDRCWDISRIPREPEELTVRPYITLLYFNLQTLDVGDIDFNYNVMMDLLKKRDFILLLGKGLIVDDPAVSVEETAFQPFFNLIGRFSSVESTRDFVKPYWLLVLDGLLTVDRVNSTSKSKLAIKKWKEFGDKMKLEDFRLRQGVVARTRSRSGCRQGCNWIKCPLHDDAVVVPSREILRCTGCNEVVYCSLHCQRSDWLEDGHKEVCKRLPS